MSKGAFPSTFHSPGYSIMGLSSEMVTLTKLDISKMLNAVNCKTGISVVVVRFFFVLFFFQLKFE